MTRSKTSSVEMWDATPVLLLPYFGMPPYFLSVNCFRPLLFTKTILFAGDVLATLESGFGPSWRQWSTDSDKTKLKYPVPLRSDGDAFSSGPSNDTWESTLE